MDKEFCWYLIAFFTVCAIIITWTVKTVPTRSKGSKYFMRGYVTFTWMCIVGLIVCVLLAK
jgi:hypothetical protein